MDELITTGKFKLRADPDHDAHRYRYRKKKEEEVDLDEEDVKFDKTLSEEEKISDDPSPPGWAPGNDETEAS